MAEGKPPRRSAPEPAVTRLSFYLRHLERLREGGIYTTSSRRLGDGVGCTAAQVRKDLAYFGQFGRPGVGYPVEELAASLKRILGTDHMWKTALVGVGNLGSALVAYEGYRRRGFVISCAFDSDGAKVGRLIGSVRVEDVSRFREIVERDGIRLGVIAVGAGEAQAVADMMRDAGIEGILNFAPIDVSVPEETVLYTVDLAVRLEQISYHLVHRRRAGKG